MKVPQHDAPTRTQQAMNVVQESHDELVAEVIDQTDAVYEVLWGNIELPAAQRQINEIESLQIDFGFQTHLFTPLTDKLQRLLIDINQMAVDSRLYPVGLIVIVNLPGRPTGETGNFNRSFRPKLARSLYLFCDQTAPVSNCLCTTQVEESLVHQSPERTLSLRFILIDPFDGHEITGISPRLRIGAFRNP